MSDTKNILKCPACGKEMTKILIQDAGINVDICTEGCGGILFDNRELEKFDDLNENADEILNSLSGKIFEKVDETAIRNCPVCKTPMVKMGSGKGNIEIDVCNSCGAKFLDNGELEKIRESEIRTNEKADLIIENLYEKNLNIASKNNYGKFRNKRMNAIKRRQFFEKIAMIFIYK